MRKLTFIVPHFRTWKWTAICIHNLVKYGVPLESEIILVDNSPGHPSIKAITDTELGAHVRLVSGNPEFTSHGLAYDIGYTHATGDAIFTVETDSFPTRHGYFDEYVKAAADYDIIGPEIPQSAGRYVHPAGCLYKRSVLDAADAWRNQHREWAFAPGAAVELGLNARPYHVVGPTHFLWDQANDSLRLQIALWRQCGAWQEMRSFDEDSWDTYPQRTGIKNFSPVAGKDFYMKIGYEAGQWLAYFAEAQGFRVLRAPTQLVWMQGHERSQAAYSNVFGGFMHAWCGTMSNLDSAIPSDVRAYKIKQQNEHFDTLPESLRQQILALEKSYT